MTTPETDRWYLIWSHRDELLKIARRRTVTVEDAEDAVHEAMLRASERPWLDDERLGAWLTTVTVRLCVDRHRQVARDADARGHTPGTVAVPVEEAVCDRAEARWLAGRSRELPPRQAEALWLKAEDLDVAQVAREMGLNYRTVESLLARARRTLRRSLAGTLALVCWLTGRSRSGGGSGPQVAVAASSAATLAVLGFGVPGSLAPGHVEPRPSVGHQADGAPGPEAGPVPSGAARLPSGRTDGWWHEAGGAAGPEPSADSQTDADAHAGPELRLPVPLPAGHAALPGNLGAVVPDLELDLPRPTDVPVPAVPDLPAAGPGADAQVPEVAADVLEDGSDLLAETADRLTPEAAPGATTGATTGTGSALGSP